MARGRRINATNQGGVQVEGLAELRRALRLIGPAATAQLAVLNKQAARHVASGAQSAARSLGGVAAKTAPSIRTVGGSTSAGVSFGGAGYEFAGGAEFGAIQYPQFKPWRGNGSTAGYFIYPTIRRDGDQIAEIYADGIGRLLERQGL